MVTATTTIERARESRYRRNTWTKLDQHSVFVPYGAPRPFSDFVNAGTFLAVKPPPETVFHAFTRLAGQQQAGSDEFATAQTRVTAETEAVEFMSTNQDEDLNNKGYSCQYASLQRFSPWA